MFGFKGLNDIGPSTQLTENCIRDRKNAMKEEKVGGKRIKNIFCFDDLPYVQIHRSQHSV